MIPFLLSALILSIVTVSLWLPDGYMIMGHDSGYRLVIPEFFQSLFFTWSNALNFGISTLFNPSVIPIHLPELVLSLLIRNDQLVQRLVLIFWHVVNLSAIYVAFLLIRPRLGKIFLSVMPIASLLYAVNFLNLHAWSVLWRTKFSTQFVLPLLVLFLYGTLQDRVVNTRKLIVVAIFIALFNGGGSPPLYGPLIVAWLTTGIYSIVISPVRRLSTRLFVKATLQILGIFTILSAFWLVPYIVYAISSYASQLQAQGGIEGVVAIVNAVSKNASMLSLFRLQGLPSWNKETLLQFVHPYLNNPLLIAGSFMLPLLAVASFFFAKEKKEKQFILLIFVLLAVGMFFTAGSHEPTGSVFKLMLYIIPGFGIFRTAFYKFGMIPWFSMSVLSAFTVVKLSILLQQRLKRTLYRFIFIGGFIFFVIAYYAPFFQGDFFNYNAPFTNKVMLPAYVKNAVSYIHANTPQEAKILLLPRFDWDRMDGYTWGYWGPDPLARMIMYRPIVSDGNNPPEIVDALYQSLYEKRFDDFLTLLRITGIHTILWRSDALYSDKITNGTQLEFVEKDLAKLPQIRLNASFDAWRIYTVAPEVRSSLFNTTGDYMYTDVSYEQYLRAGGTQEQTLVDSRSVPAELIRARCVLCDPREIDRFEGTADFIPILLLPGSKLYFLIRWKEQRMLQTVSKQPKEVIRVQYSFLRIRISEIRRLIDERGSLKYFHISSGIKRVEDHLMQARKQLALLSPLESNEAKAEMIQILKGYRFVVGSLHGDTTIEKSVSGLKRILDEESRYLEEDVWYTKNSSHLAYIVDIPEDGIYALRTVSDDRTKPVIQMNGKTLEGSVSLSRGTHRVEVVISEENHKGSTSEKIVPGAVYQLGFDYKPEGTESAQVIVEEYRSWSKDAAPFQTRLSLANNGGWQVFQRTIVPDRLTTDVRISVTGSSIQKFRFVRVSIPEVYVFKKYERESSTGPKVTYTSINPASYRVHIRDAKKPFILNFIQLFDPLWKATISHAGTDEVVHVVANSFSNGWIITKTGDYDILVQYKPQQFVRIGFIITVFGYICLSAYLITFKKEKQ